MWLAAHAGEIKQILWLATYTVKMELSCPLGIAVTHTPSFIANPYNKSFIGQVCWGFKMAGLILFVFMVLAFILVHKHAKNKLGQYTAILTSRWANYLYSLNFFCAGGPVLVGLFRDSAPGNSASCEGVSGSRDDFVSNYNKELK